ncbi:Heme/hemopexin utilization protein C precursor [Lignipirellula cremea]|uniref:Heme/hemopexin utilization protein C n=2 Tax=Lignipirellula cremea TaxID=2528010 RepID=A0A518DNI8_9BACT|nr:Heme/hemopexin utilization protein C precursor [Lignipirellula cremea]
MLAVALVAGCAATVSGQEVFREYVTLAQPAANDSAPGNALPPVEVRPPATDDTGSGSDADALPPVEVRPPADTSGSGSNSPATGNNFPASGGDSPLDLNNGNAAAVAAAAMRADLARAYPSLSQSQLGQAGRFNENTGILRDGQSLFDTPAAVSIRTRQEIEERQAPDMFHALQNEVGVLLQSTAAGQASPFIRGLTGQQVLILVDGIRLNNSVTRRGPNQYFNTIDPGMVDHIEVLRGQGSVLWGSDAIGGVINIVSRGPDLPGSFPGDPNYSGAQAIQYFNTANNSPYSRMNVEGWVNNTGVFAGGSYLNVGDLDTGYDNFPRQPGTSYQQFAGDIKFNYMIDRDQMLTLSMQHFEQEDLARSDRYPGYPGDRNNSNSFAAATFFDPQQRDLTYLRYQALDPLPFIDAVTVTASYNRQKETVTRGVPTTRAQTTDVDTVGVSAVASKEMYNLGKLTSGVDWYYDDVDSPFWGASGPIIPDDAYYSRIGAFVNWNVPLTERLSGVAGARYEAISAAGTPIVNIAGVDTPVFAQAEFSDWVGSAGLVYELTPEVHLVGSIAEGFRAPNLSDLMSNNPNVQQQGQSIPSLGLQPEHSITYEVGVKTDTGRLRTQTFVYWIDLQDNIVSQTTPTPFTFSSANQDSYIQGVEFNGELLLERGWSLYGNFWYTYGQNQVTNAPLSRIPPMQGIMGFRYRSPRQGRYFDIYTWMSDRQDRLDPVSDVRDERIPIGGTPGFATLNLRGGQSFGAHQQHKLSLSLENLTDQPYLVQGSGVYGTGFTARMGYTWTR